MQLLWLYLVFSWYFPKNICYPIPQPQTPWKQSRYIIDNRRNLLFKKPFLALYSNANPIIPTYPKSTNITFDKNHESFIEFQKDLSVEASVKNDYYNEYPSKNLLRANDENFLYKIKDDRNKNYTEIGYNAQNLVQSEDISEFNASPAGNLIKVSQNPNIGEQMLKWSPNQNLYITNAHARGPTFIEGSLLSPQEVKSDFQKLNPSNGRFDFEESRNSYEFAPVVLYTTTPSNFWDNSSHKAKSAIRIDNNVEPKEKHVYETRIETVSYHREVIFSPPQKKSPEEKKHESYTAAGTSYNEKEPEKTPEENYEEEEANYEEKEKNYEEDEKNYEVDESIHVMTNGRFHGPTNPEVEDNNNKFGFIVEGKNHRRYRVEERTPDGFIVGEYGVVSHDDGSLRGVRYTADSAANPQLIYQALINFLSL